MLGTKPLLCMLAASIAAVWGLAGYNYVANDDPVHVLFSICPCIVVLLGASMVDVKDAVGWAGRYSPICLICGCLLAIGHAYDHYVQFRRNDFLQGELSESQWEQIDQLHTLYMCSSVISLLLIFTTCKLSFRLQLPQLLVLGTVVVLSQIVLSTST